MKKNKKHPNYDYSANGVEKRLKRLIKSNKTLDNPVNKVNLKYDKNLIKDEKDNLIKNTKEFINFFYNIEKISSSEKYKYNISVCLNTLKEIFEPYDIDFLSAYIYIYNMLVKYKDIDFSVALNTVTNIIKTKRNKNSFLNKINHYINTGNYHFLLDEEHTLKILLSALLDDKIKREQEKIISKYHENLKQSRK